MNIKVEEKIKHKFLPWKETNELSDTKSDVWIESKGIIT